MNRRRFLTSGIASLAGLVIGFRLPAARGQTPAVAGSEPKDFSPNAWLQISGQGIVTILLQQAEMGQNIRTSLAMLIAEELEADWTKVRVKQAAYLPETGFALTGGSWSIGGRWERLRMVGATVREMFVTAAAQNWKVDKSECRAENGSVRHSNTGRKASYGELIPLVSKLEVPKEAKLKEAKDFRLIGRSLRRVNGSEIITGKAVYGFDVKIPQMLYAVVARPPVFGGKLLNFDASRAKTIKGVRHVVQISRGIAVVADSTWTALKGRDALEIKWDEGANKDLNSDRIWRQFEDASRATGATARNEGDAAKAIADAARKLEAVYKLPFQAHAPMETMNCTAHVTKDRCEIWVPTQFQSDAHGAARQITGLPASAVFLHTTLMGGSFGRRFEPDYVIEAVETSKAVNAPVQIVWSREDDMKHGVYRPASLHKMSAGLDGENNLLCWSHRIVSPSVAMGVTERWATQKNGLKNMIKNNLDTTGIVGAEELPYLIPNLRVEHTVSNTPVPVGWWRGVANNQNAFANECFIDEIAAAAGRDAYEFRLELLKQPRQITFRDSLLETSRLERVLKIAAKESGWETALPTGRGRGIACHPYIDCFSYVAQVIELSVEPNGKITIHQITCVIDCGTAVNPDGIKAQMEGSIVFGLSAALDAEITIKNGRVQQNTFRNYPVVRMAGMPPVKVFIVPSNASPGGAGEPGVPPTAPALANAIYAATGQRLRRLPIRAEDLR